MANESIFSAETEPKENGFSESTSPSSKGSLIPRKIEFHLARKPFLGFAIDGGGGDFRLETLNPTSELPRPGTISGHTIGKKKSDGPEILESMLDPELTFGITFRRIGAGLQNLGNTCFLNSVLQCLTYTEPLAAYLQSGKHQMSCRIAGFCALCAIQKHVSHALQSTGRILAPKDLVSNLRCISRSFQNARQEDAHEYMVNLLESMHKCCLPSGMSSDTPNAYEKSLVHKIFGGRLRSQVKCMQCSYCSNKFDPFLDLSLEIVKAESLHKALMHFTATEQLDGGEGQYHCQRCRQKVKALKQLTVYQAPYVLTVHLKRFASHDPGQKIDKKVHFGPTLDLDPFVSGSNEGDLKYTLYGVLVHAGWSTHSGHYYCFVRTSTGMWYSLDDNRVFQVNERTVLEQKAYMLFYVRDRKKISSKKPVDVRKESLGSNIMQNKTCFSTNQAPKEAVPNGSSVKKFDDMANCAAMAQRDAMNVGLSKETILKQATVQNINGPAMADSSAIKREPALNFSLMDQKETLLKQAPVKETDGLAMANTNSCAMKRVPASEISLIDQKDTVLKPTPVQKISGPAVLDSSAIKRKPEVKSSLKARLLGPVKGVSDSNPNNGACFPVTAPVATGTKLNGCSENSNKNINCSVPVLSTCNDPLNSGTEKLESAKTFQKVECIINESAAMDMVSEKPNGSVQELGVVAFVKLSSPLITENGSLYVKSPGHKRQRKSKKKLLKYGAPSMRLGSKILFGASLSVRKKKHKRRKQRPLGTAHFSLENSFDGDFVSADLGPSTSEKTKRISLHSSHSQRKKLKSRAERANVSAGKDELKACAGFQREPGERVGQSSAVLNGYKQPQKTACSSMTSNQRGAGEPESLEAGRMCSMQNGLMNTLTRGLEDTTVTRWEGIELSSPSQTFESGSAEGTSIGYVLDEWDEEYDRGKRKKVRQFKRNFGGPNPFQEIASKKAQLKKPKIDRSSSGHKPFRI